MEKIGLLTAITGLVTSLVGLVTAIVTTWRVLRSRKAKNPLPFQPEKDSTKQL